MREGLQKIVPSNDTIVAIATPPGRSGIGVVRISGSDARAMAARFLRTRQDIVHRCAVVGTWLDEEGAVVDEVVATFFATPHSYTGEDVLEVSAHGNPFILSGIVAIVQKAGARLAAPGEFTLRAVSNRKMDLIQAEAVRDFINAQTDAQARTALRQLGGALSKRIGPVKERLVDVIAEMEAGIDFADDDIEPPDDAKLTSRVRDISVDLRELQKTYGYGKLLASGIRLAILGKPNVGKSSLFNRLVAADRAIVTEIPGTTRDVLAETTNLDGIPLRFFDTAGLHDTADPIERLGVSRSLETLSEADLVLAVLDGSSRLDQDDYNMLSRAAAASAHIVVINKFDLPQAVDREDIGQKTMVQVSAKTGQGLDSLEEALRAFLNNGAGPLSDCILTNARQNESLLNAIQALEAGHAALLNRTPHEMVLLDFYQALAALNELTGEVVTDDILGRIFSTFCVGK